MLSKKFIKTTIFDYLNENISYRKLMNIYDIPVDIMWYYREFDRCGVDNLYGDEYIEKLTTDIKEKGIKIPIKLQIDKGKALIVEGNHRLCIAKKLEFKTIPVQVVYGSFGSINIHKTKQINYNPDLWKNGFFDDIIPIMNKKSLAYSFMNEYELPYYEYKDKIDFQKYSKWFFNNRKELLNFLIGDLQINDITLFNNDRNLTNEILIHFKNMFNKFSK